nr:hypothetical protein [Tanacetum cinerariifolium]
ARALIEVSADKELKHEVTMAVPNIVGNEISHTFETIIVEYEWKPPLCLDCHVFGHSNDTCPKRIPVKVTPAVEVDNDGFATVTKRKSKAKGPDNNPKKNITGFRLNEITVPVISQSNGGNAEENVFGDTSKATHLTADFDSEVEETLIIETQKLKGASTPGWNTDMVNIMVLSQTSQAMHVKIIHKVTNDIIFCTFIYAGNLPSERRYLWSELECHKNVVRGYPWMLMGDFNVALNLEDYFSGPSCLNSATNDFKACVNKIEMKALKKPLRKLLHSHGNLHDRVNALRNELDEPQKALDRNPLDTNLPKLDEERFLKQKAKIEWLEVGDSNFAFFHKSVKSRNQRSRIESIRDAADCEVMGPLVVDCFVNHYHQFLGTDMEWKRGLRQGDPISPYLFTMVMEVLTLIIKRRVRVSDTFRYHNRCEELQLVNICFADDLFIFTRGDVESTRLIMEALDEFKMSS